jgi:CP family cyanate transporter-like MFS transporter
LLVVAFNLRLAVSAVPPIVGSLGLSPSLQSWLVAIPVICFGLGAFAGPFLDRRLAVDWALFGLLVALTIGIGFRGAWPGWGLFPGTVVACLALALMNVEMPQLVQRHVGAHTGPMTAGYVMSLALGGALAAGLTVPILVQTGGSIQLALGAWAAPAILALLLWLPMLVGTPWRRDPAPLSSLKATAGSGRVWEVALFFGLQSLLYYSVSSWLPTLYHDRGITTLFAGTLLAILNVAGLAGNLISPLAAMRLQSFSKPAVGVMATIAIALIGVLAAPTSTAIVWVVLLGAGLGGSLSLSLLLIVDRTVGNPSLSSTVQGFGYLLSATGPLLVGFLHIATRAWTVSLALLVALAVVEMGLSFRLDPQRLNDSRRL